MEKGNFQVPDEKGISEPNFRLLSDFIPFDRNIPNQSKLWSKQLGFWEKQLENLPTYLNLPIDRPRPAIQSFTGAQHSFRLSEKLSQSLKTLSQEQGVSLFTTLASAFSVLLARHSNQNDLAFGIQAKEPYFNTLALRAHLDKTTSFRDLLTTVEQTCSKAYENQELPFENLISVINPVQSLAHTPLIQVMFEFQKLDFSSQKNFLKFDLILSIREQSGGFAGSFEYNSDLFDAPTIIRIAEHFEILLRGIIKNPQQSIAKLPLLTDSERNQLLREFNKTEAFYPKEFHVHHLFEMQANNNPDATAIVFQDKSLSYGDLNTRANRLAHHLQELGVGPEKLVGICVERNFDMIVGMLATLKAGGAYVPIDSSIPRDRIDYMLRDSQVSVVLTQKGLLSKLPDTQATLIRLDRDADKWE